LKKRFNLNDFNNPAEPVLIFGLYNFEDYKFALNHKAYKVIIWCGSDALKIRPEIVNIKARHISISKQVQNTLKSFNLQSELIPICPVIIDNLPVKKRGNAIHFYCGDDAKQYGGDFLDEIKKRTGLSIIKTSYNLFSKKDLVAIYNQCFIGLRITEHDGIAVTVCEMGLMGRKMIHNGDHPNCLHYKNIDDVVRLIMQEFLNRDKNNEMIAREMRDYLNVGDKWLNVPKVSVIMNTYNEHEHLLRDAIESYINQCHEIILSCVESDGAAIEIGKSYGKKVKICKTAEPDRKSVV
jgi:hypothetical protein